MYTSVFSTWLNLNILSFRPGRERTRWCPRWPSQRSPEAGHAVRVSVPLKHCHGLDYPSPSSWGYTPFLDHHSSFELPMHIDHKTQPIFNSSSADVWVPKSCWIWVASQCCQTSFSIEGAVADGLGYGLWRVGGDPFCAQRWEHHITNSPNFPQFPADHMPSCTYLGLEQASLGKLRARSSARRPFETCKLTFKMTIKMICQNENGYQWNGLTCFLFLTMQLIMSNTWSLCFQLPMVILMTTNESW